MERLRAVPGRTKLLVIVGVVLLIVLVTGRCSGVDIAEERAIAVAEAALAADPGAFTPERTETKVLRQGFPPRPMWVVVFTVADPGGGAEDFLHHAAVWVDASSGDVREIKVEQPGGG